MILRCVRNTQESTSGVSLSKGGRGGIEDHSHKKIQQNVFVNSLGLRFFSLHIEKLIY